MEDHPELKCSKFTKDFTYKKGKQLWEELASNLNSMPGANKNWEKWRKVSINELLLSISLGILPCFMLPVPSKLLVFLDMA